MAEIEVRTPEDLDKVFTDMFRFLQEISSRIAYIEMELHKLNSPSISITPSTGWPRPITYGPGSGVPIRPSKLTLTTTGDSNNFVDKLIRGEVEYEEKEHDA